MLKEKLNTIAQTIFDKKGFNILVIDVQGISTLTNIYMIAEGNVSRHVKALASAIVDELGKPPFFLEGERDGEWVILDYGEVIIHLMIPDMREKYALEELWKEGKIVDVEIKTSM